MLVRLILAAATALTLVSCSDETDKPVSLASLVGTNWVGHFEGVDGEGNRKSPIRVNLSLKQDESFVTTNLDKLNAKAQGRYVDLPQTGRVTLDVSESSFNLFGQQGDSRAYDYKYHGSELNLEGVSGRYSLKQAGIDGGESDNNSFIATWRCSESGSTWTIVIGAQRFEASKVRTGERPIQISGPIEFKLAGDTPYQAILIADSANPAEFVGARLMAQTLESGNMSVIEVDANNAPHPGKAAFECQR